MDLKGKNIVIGVTGGIAVYKVCYLVSSLRKQGACVDVAMTKNATEFVSKLTFETLSNNPVTVDTFVRDREWEVGHVSLAKKASLCVIAPATADFIGKLANGIADDFLSTTVMAMKCPVLICPAMNTNMLESKAYIENEKKLLERGFYFVNADEGHLACGDNGKGRLAEPQEIEKKCIDILFPKKDYFGKRVIVTAGGTIEPIDPVRYIGNNSSGKMGLAIAKAVADRGGKVIVIKAKTTVDFKDERFEVIDVTTTKDMYDAVMNNLERADIVIKAAAPCDYRVKNSFDKKIKAGKDLILELERTEDIAEAIGKVKGDKKLVIFAAETNDLIKNAKEKLAKKNADMVVANDVTMMGAGFNVDTNIATIVKRNKELSLPILTKRQLADKILDELVD